MFSKNSKAYSVYLLFRFVYSLAASMATVLSIVYHLEVVQLDAFQLVLVGTVLETSCFLFEIPTGVVADLYSRRRSVLGIVKICAVEKSPKSEKSGNCS